MIREKLTRCSRTSFALPYWEEHIEVHIEFLTQDLESSNFCSDFPYSAVDSFLIYHARIHNH